MSSMQHRDNLVHVAFDASKDVLVAGVLRPGEETPSIERVFNDEPSIRRSSAHSPTKGSCAPATRPDRPATSCTASQLDEGVL